MQLELQIHLRVLGACCVVSVCLYVGRPASNTVCEHTTDAFCILKIGWREGWREETMHVEGKKEGWEVPPFH